MALDRFSLLRQMGYYGTEAEMLEKYMDDTTGLDTIGEALGRALDAAMARQILEVTTVAPGGPVTVPGGLSATGVPSNTNFLRGDGTWAVPAGGGGGGGGTDPNAAPANGSATISGAWNFTTQPTGITKASVGLGAVDNTSDINKPVSTAGDAKYATKVNPNFTGSTAFTVPVGIIPQTAVAGLVTALTTLVAKIASTSDVTVGVGFVLRTVNASAVRPANINAEDTAIWNLPGDIPPTNMGDNDLWIGA